MKLIDEIIQMASDGKTPIADGLRKCLVLSFQLKNEKLKEWVEKELNGFNRDDIVPKYREAMFHSKGNFSGPGGARVTNRPLPMTVLHTEHWDLLTNRMAQPIAAYETLVAAGLDQNPSVPWAPDLILQYQESFIAEFALSSAWQEVPMSKVIGLCEEVRNRLLRFALEVKEEMGHVGYVFSVARSRIVRLVIGLLFAVPAARAGHDVILALAHIGIPSEWWRESFAMLGAVAVGSTACARMSILTDPALRPGVAFGRAQPPIGATTKGR